MSRSIGSRRMQKDREFNERRRSNEGRAPPEIMELGTYFCDVELRGGGVDGGGPSDDSNLVYHTACGVWGRGTHRSVVRELLRGIGGRRAEKGAANSDTYVCDTCGTRGRGVGGHKLQADTGKTLQETTCES